MAKIRRPGAGYADRVLASAAGKARFRRWSPEQVTERQSNAALALLRQHGTGYYAALGRASAAKKKAAKLLT
jgi:hypothetical protein